MINNQDEIKLTINNAIHLLIIARLQNNKRQVNKQQTIIDYYTDRLVQTSYVIK